MSENNKKTKLSTSKYKPELCEMLINHFQEGLSFASFAAIAGVSRAALYQWLETYPDFKEAKRIGEPLSLLFWEQSGIDGLWEKTEYDENGKMRSKTKLNTTAWIFNMKNRFNWRDKSEVENTHKLISPEDAKKLSIEELKMMAVQIIGQVKVDDAK